jgi:hypothetical protein
VGDKKKISSTGLLFDFKALGFDHYLSLRLDGLAFNIEITGEHEIEKRQIDDFKSSRTYSIIPHREGQDISRMFPVVSVGGPWTSKERKKFNLGDNFPKNKIMLYSKEFHNYAFPLALDFGLVFVGDDYYGIKK